MIKSNLVTKGAEGSAIASMDDAQLLASSLDGQLGQLHSGISIVGARDFREFAHTSRDSGEGVSMMLRSRELASRMKAKV
jgi:hypothetical protein